MSITAGTNLSFKRGTQAALDALLASSTPSATPGAFYLTDDTHRLYVGNDDHTLSPVNEGITFVQSLTDLPSPITKAHQGQFYYVDDLHVLCVASGVTSTAGDTSRWVQINPDTFFKVDNMTTSITSVPSGNNTLITVQTALTQNGYNGGPNGATNGTTAPVSTDFKIIASPSAGVTVDSTNKTITFSPPAGATYTLTGANKTGGGVTLTLEGSNNTTYDIDLLQAQGSTVIPTWDATNNAVVFSGGGFANATFAITESSVTGEDGKVIFTLTDAANNSLQAAIKPVITYGDDGSTNTPTASAVGTLSGNSDNTTLTIDLDVYTTDEVDALIQNALQNAEGMYFAGTIGTGGTHGNLAALNTNITDYSSGATFKFIESFTSPTPSMTGLNDGSVEIGDLVIVQGPEDSNGKLTGQNVVYYYIPSGDDQDLRYRPDIDVTTNKEITFNLTNGSSADIEKHRINFAGDSKITLTGSSTDATGYNTNQTLTFGHATQTVTPTTATAKTQVLSGDSYTAITGIAYDSTGHLTGYTTQQINFTVNAMSSLVEEVSTTGVTGGVKVLSHYTDGLATTDSQGFKLISDSLQIGMAAGTTDTIKAELVWGSF